MTYHQGTRTQQLRFQVDAITKLSTDVVRQDIHDSLSRCALSLVSRCADVVRTVDRINREDENGNRLVRIHAVGFPVQFANAPRFQTTGTRFATLMRILCYKNGGTFVGLQNYKDDNRYGL